jgi:TRAP-type C4-dicarboxylate transport system permease small subunit
MDHMHAPPQRALAASRAVRLAEGVLGGIVAVLLMAMMLITVVDVMGRYGLRQPVPGAYELIELMLAIVIFTALPLVCLRDENIAVTVLTERFPARTRQLHAGVVSLLSAGVLVAVAWRLYAHAAQLASYGDVTVFLRLPRGPIGYTMAILSALGAIALAVVAVDCLKGVRTPTAPTDAG